MGQIMGASGAIFCLQPSGMAPRITENSRAQNGHLVQFGYKTIVILNFAAAGNRFPRPYTNAPSGPATLLEVNHTQRPASATIRSITENAHANDKDETLLPESSGSSGPRSVA